MPDLLLFRFLMVFLLVDYKYNGMKILCCTSAARLTLQWRWTRTVMQTRRGLMRAGMGRTDPLLAALRQMPACAVPLCVPPQPPALPLALGLAPAVDPSPAWTVPLYRRLVRGPAPCPPPAPGPSHTMTGPIILLCAQRSASTQECRETKVFTRLETV